MWQTCQQTLQKAYRDGVPNPSSQSITGVWAVIGTMASRRAYIVKNLGELEARESSVLYLNSTEAMQDQDVIRLGAREDPHDDEYLYMLDPSAALANAAALSPNGVAPLTNGVVRFPPGLAPLTNGVAPLPNGVHP